MNLRTVTFIFILERGVGTGWPIAKKKVSSTAETVEKNLWCKPGKPLRKIEQLLSTIILIYVVKKNNSSSYFPPQKKKIMHNLKVKKIISKKIA